MSIPVCSVAASERSCAQRYRYHAQDRHGVKEVIVDVTADGHQDWGEQYGGESRWYPHTPTTKERGLLRVWVASGTEPAHALLVVIA